MEKQLSPLKALEKLIENYYKMCQDTGYDDEYQRTNLPIDCEIIETALKNYEKQNHYIEVLEDRINNVETTYARQKKALEIIKNFIHIEFEYNNLQTPQYIISASGKAHIEQEEFDLLKEVLK